MKEIYLILCPAVQEKMTQCSDQIIRYICKSLNIAVPPYSGPLHESLEIDKRRFITVEKLESRTWREYLDTAMSCIDDSDLVVRVDVGAFQPHSIAEDILEQYCSLINARINSVLIDAADWLAITSKRGPQFVYSQLPDANICTGGSEN